MPARPHAALFGSNGGLLVATLLVALAFPACSADEEGGGTTPATDSGGASDGGGLADGLPTPVSPTEAIDVYACPGGHLCACGADEDCNSGHCIPGSEGSICGEPCAPACGAGQICKWLHKGGKGTAICVAVSQLVCNPCKSSAECRTFGHDDAVCVDYGAAGRFCGAACTGDVACGEGFVCTMVPVLEGGESMQCVAAAAAGAPAGSLGACTCNQAAKDQALATDCYQNGPDKGARCWGTRACGADGLSACSAVSAKTEVCDGVDNDCDGVVDEVTCGDDNPCTADSCAGADGCKHTPIDKACTDNKACTVNDSCKAGTCVPGPDAVCDDGNACTKDSCSEPVGCNTVPDAAGACDDGQACTQGDGCQGGKCIAGTAKQCDDSKPCTLDGCDPTTGDCKNTWTKGLPCDDGKACTHTDLCGADQDCKGSAVNCDDGNVCTDDACEGASGCTHSASQSGATCDDGDPCTGTGNCSSGVCQAGQAKVCTTNKTCWTAACNPATGQCVEAPSPSGAACDDGDGCTGGDVCTASKCTGTQKNCDDGKPCTTDSCDKQSGCKNVTKADLAVCDDGDKCTDNDLCVAGVCKAGPKTECDDKDPCTTDSCDKAKGCVTAPANDGIGCDDGDANTGPDTCSAGKCKPGPKLSTCKADVDCDDKDACTDNKCDTGTGKCSNPTKTDAKCDDGDACTAGDKCGDKDGKAACLPGAATKCDDGNGCTTDSCDSKTGCSNKAVTDGVSCDDGAKCTPSDTCTAGKCVAGKPVVCSEYKACQINACDKATGKCAFTPQKSGDDCDDQDICTVGTQCKDNAGKLECVGGTKDDCDDKNVCTKDSATCDPQKGCTHDPQSGGCDDGKKCTQGDACKDGKCSGQAKNCDDKNTCTADSCDEAKGGCQYNNAEEGAKCDDGDACTTTDVCKSGKCGGTLPTATVSRLAGSTQGDVDGSGKAAAFTLPQGLAIDGAGDVWVADAGKHKIRKVTAKGVVTTVAGLGLADHKDGIALLARFRGPTDITFDGAGLAYVADRANHRIRKIAADGTVSTLAGTAEKPAAGKDPVGGHANGKGVAAKFNYPTGIVWSKGYNVLFIADQDNHRIRKVEIDGTVANWAGNGSAGAKDGSGAAAQFNKPSGLAIDAAGNNLYVSDLGGHRIRKVDFQGVVTTVAGSGNAGLSDAKGVLAQFSSPWGMSLDVAGNLLVADSGNNRIRSIKLADGTVTTYAGKGQGKTDGPALQALFGTPTAIVADGNGNGYVADSANFWIRLIADPSKACVAKTKGD